MGEIEALRQRGFRLTPQRLAVLRILHNSGKHLSPLDVFHIARQELPGITEATVYRTLSFLSEQGLILATHIGNGQLVYESAEREHHHLVCRLCGHSHEIDHQWMRQLYAEFQAQTGYKIDSMHVTFFGLCPACQPN